MGPSLRERVTVMDARDGRGEEVATGGKGGRNWHKGRGTGRGIDIRRGERENEWA